MQLESPERIRTMWDAVTASYVEKRYPENFPALPDLPAARYTSEEFFAIENRFLWTRTWLFVGITGELTAPGSFRSFTLSGVPVLLVRGKDDVIRAFYNTCQHRGSMLTIEPEGTAHNFTCRYHCWSYDLQGALKFVPDEYGFAGLDKTKRPLRAIRCETIGDLIFLNLDDDAAPLAEYLGDMGGLLIATATHRLRVKQRMSFNVDCNWKCVQDNFAENYHAKFVHAQTIDQVIDSKTSALQLIEGGHDAIAIKSRTVLSSGMGAAFFRKNAEETAEQTESVLKEISRLAQRSYNVFPNCTVPPAENMFPIITLWPESVGVTRVEVLFVKNCEPSTDNEETDQATLTFFDTFIKEDLAALAGMHQALSHGGIQSIPLCFAEQFIYHHNQNIDRAIGTENIPLTMRVQPVDLPIASNV